MDELIEDIVEEPKEPEELTFEDITSRKEEDEEGEIFTPSLKWGFAGTAILLISAGLYIAYLHDQKMNAMMTGIITHKYDVTYHASISYKFVIDDKYVLAVSDGEWHTRNNGDTFTFRRRDIEEEIR